MLNRSSTLPQRTIDLLLLNLILHPLPLMKKSFIIIINLITIIDLTLILNNKNKFNSKNFFLQKSCTG